MLVAGPVVATVSLLAALLTTNAAGLPLRDPDNVAGGRLVVVLCLVAVLIGLDVLVRAGRRTGTLPPSRAALKSVVPLLRPGDLFDRQLAELDRSLFGGRDPAALLHDLLGTGAQAHVLSGAYMLLFAFIPGTLAFALVFSRNLQSGLLYVTAQSINWLLAAVSYYLLPALGPVYADPAAFAQLPTSAVTQLQDLLLDQRLDFLRDPVAGTAQSIGAFSSLHVSFFFTAALAAHLLGLARAIRIGAWVLFGLTTAATIYLGWHYVVDDLAGVALGALAIVLARGLTGVDPRTARGLSVQPARPT
jgi:hypothetical protein